MWGRAVNYHIHWRYGDLVLLWKLVEKAAVGQGGRLHCVFADSADRRKWQTSKRVRLVSWFPEASPPAFFYPSQASAQNKANRPTGIYFEPTLLQHLHSFCCPRFSAWTCREWGLSGDWALLFLSALVVLILQASLPSGAVSVAPNLFWVKWSGHGHFTSNTTVFAEPYLPTRQKLWLILITFAPRCPFWSWVLQANAVFGEGFVVSEHILICVCVFLIL